MARLLKVTTRHVMLAIFLIPGCLLFNLETTWNFTCQYMNQALSSAAMKMSRLIKKSFLNASFPRICFQAKEDSLSKAENKAIALELDNKILKKEKLEADNEIARLKAECEKVT